MSVLNSRRFWSLILDVVVSSVIYGVSTFGTAQAQETAKFVIVTLQPVAIFLIAALTIDDSRLNVAMARAKGAVEVAAVQNGVHPDYPPIGLDQSGPVLDERR